MANEIIRPTLLPSRADPVATEVVPSDNGATVGGVTWADGVNAAVPPASQPESEAGVINTKRMTPLTTKQAIDAQVPPLISGAISGLGLDTMSQESASDYTKTADLAAVALSNDYGDLGNRPTLGSAAATDAADYATAAQGGLAETAVQPADLAGVATSGDYEDLGNKPTARLLPPGGLTSQALIKRSDADYDAEWEASAAATAVSYAPQTLTTAQKGQARANIEIDRPILVFATGQSNMARYEAYSWTPPENVRLWNHDPMTDPATHVGTAFGPLPSDKISVSWSFAAEIARANPLRTVYVVNTAQGGQPISKWLPGGGAPDLYATGKNNIEAALSVIDEEVDLVHLWWQGENDAANPSNYLANFSAYRARLTGETWWSRDTPIAVFGISPFRSGTPGLQAKRFNKYLALAAAEDPEKVNYVATSTFATISGAWNVGDDYLHVTALGHLLTGRLAHRVIYEGMGRADIAGMAVDPDTKQLLQPNIIAFLAAITATLTGPADLTGYTSVFNDTGGAFNEATGVFTAPVSGLYEFQTTLATLNNPDITALRLKVNGSPRPSWGATMVVPAAPGVGSAQGSMLVKLNQGDTVNLDIGVGQASGAQRFSGRFVG